MYYICTVSAIIFWSASFIGTKIAGSVFSPLMLCLLRFLCATAVLLVLRITGKDLFQPVEKKDRMIIFLSALIGVTVYYACENFAVSVSTAGMASLISGSYPAITVLVGLLFYHVKTPLKQIIGILIAMAGVLLLSWNDLSAGTGTPLGIAILIFDGFLWGFYNFIVQAIPEKYSALTVTWHQMWIGTLLFLPLLPFEEVHVLSAVTFPSILAVLFLGLLCSVGAYMLYNYGLRGISAAAAASLMNLLPVSGLILSALILHEKITLLHFIACIVIMAGVLLSGDKK